jgi:hypothetical protein
LVSCQYNGGGLTTLYKLDININVISEKKTLMSLLGSAAATAAATVLRSRLVEMWLLKKLL